MPSLESQQIKQVLRAQVAPLFQGNTPLKDLRAFLDTMSSQSPMPAGVTVEKVTIGAIPAEWITAPGAQAERVIFYLHGGGYCLGSCESHRGLVADLAVAAGARGLLPEYRLAPEHPFPAAIEDAVAAYRWLLQSGVHPSRVVIAGDSAGGGLTLATLVSLRDAGDPLPAAAFLISPWTDLAATGESLRTRAEVDPMLSGSGIPAMASVYLGDRDPKTPLGSPLYAEMKGLPPLLIHVGDEEVLLDDSTRVAERARAAGVDVTIEVWDGMWHVFHQSASHVPEARAAVEKAGGFMRERMGG